MSDETSYKQPGTFGALWCMPSREVVGLNNTVMITTVECIYSGNRKLRVIKGSFGNLVVLTGRSRLCLPMRRKSYIVRRIGNLIPHLWINRILVDKC